MTVSGAHAMREGREAPTGAPTFQLLRVCCYARTGTLSYVSRVRTYVRTASPSLPSSPSAFTVTILERAEVRLQRTVREIASLQNREIGRHGYIYGWLFCTVGRTFEGPWLLPVSTPQSVLLAQKRRR